MSETNDPRVPMIPRAIRTDFGGRQARLREAGRRVSILLAPSARPAGCFDVLGEPVALLRQRPDA